MSFTVPWDGFSIRSLVVRIGSGEDVEDWGIPGWSDEGVGEWIL